jgi:hypothetical protein
MNGLFSQKNKISLCNGLLESMHVLHGLCIVDQNHFGIVFLTMGKTTFDEV